MNKFKEKIIRDLDIEEGDKVYIYRIREKDGKSDFRRMSIGFGIIELLGWLEIEKKKLSEELCPPAPPPGLNGKKGKIYTL